MTTTCSRCGSALAADGSCPTCLLALAADHTRLSSAGETFLTAGGAPAAAATDTPVAIGPYRIVSVLGEGGMGVVYLADQTEPIKRRVALKVIKVGMDTREVVARFESERHALALMDHPGIARVIDAGASADGRPYFVMEYVPGEPITTYCDRLRLSTRRRLELFSLVCAAIQHAHQKGIIHRDLKPSNVLVMEQDGIAVPKVIDFGIAKATDQQDVEATMFTQAGLLVGTPEYMSPEQASLGSQAIDTRTDIYSLGVLLYELLVGELPFDGPTLRRAGYDEMRRIIREEEPPKPSTRITAISARAEVAARHETDAGALQKRLRGDLDWITLKALEKDPARRYASASELATDISRHLSDEPIAARAPSTLYQVRKFVRRHRLVVSAAAVVFFALIVGLLVSTSMYLRAERERLRADAERQTAVNRAYVANIAAAGAALEVQDSDSAVGYLDLADPAQRGWEWGHLHLRADPALARLEAYGRLTSAVSWVPSFGFSADGTRLHWNTEDTIQVWDATSYKPLTTLGNFGGTIRSVDTRAIRALVQAPPAQGNELRIVDVATRQTTRTLSAPQGEVIAARFSEDGARVAATLADGGAFVWDVETGRQFSSGMSRDQRFGYLAFSPDGARLAIAGAGGETSVRNVLTGGIVGVLPDSHAWSLAFSHDGRRLAAGSLDGTVRIWIPGSSEAPTVLRGHRDRVIATAFSPDDGTLVSTSYDGSIRIWDLRHPGSGTVIGGIGAPAPTSATFTPDGRRILVGSHSASSGTIRVFDAGTRGGSVSWAPPARVTALAFDSTGGVLAAGCADASVRLWTVATRTLLGTLRAGNAGATALAFTRKGLLAAGAADGAVHLWDPATGRLLRTFQGHRSGINSVAFDASGALVVSTSDDKSVQVWDVESGRSLARLDRPEETNVAAFLQSPDRIIIGSGSAAASMRRGTRRTAAVWNWRTGQVEAEVDAREGGSVTSLSVGGSGTVVMVGTGPPGAYIWDDQLRQRHAIVGEKLGVAGLMKDVMFTPDGTRFVTASVGGTLRLWQARTGDQLALLRQDSPMPGPVRVSPDGTRIASSDGALLYLWERRSGSAIEADRLLRESRYKNDLASELLDRLRRDPDLAPEVRSLAIAQAGRFLDNPERLNDTAWDTAVRPAAAADEYTRAAHLAGIAAGMAPWRPTFTTTVGLLRYRLGDHRGCIDLLTADGRRLTLTRSVIIAMARYRLGEADEARRMMAAASKEAASREMSTEFKALLAEAETVVGGRAR